MGSCFSKQTESRKTSSKKLRSNQSDFPVFDEVSANKNNSRALDSTIVPSSSDLHLLNTTTHNTITPHVGPQIMITGATRSFFNFLVSSTMLYSFFQISAKFHQSGDP